jgi:hypothetical protein
MNNYAIDTAARFGDIPFVEFTKELVTGVFDSLVEAHILQMEEYATFVNSLTQDLSTYINNTQDGVTFDQISDFVLAYDLPQVDNTDLTTVLGQLEEPAGSPAPENPTSGQPATTDTWWGGLINGLAPAVTGLVDKLNDPSENLALQALDTYNNDVLAGASTIVVPTYKQIHDAIAALIASNKYGLLQTMAKQGVMRLVVTEGEIETKITFSTWNNSSRGYKSENSVKAKNKSKAKDARGGGIIGIFRNKRKRKSTNRTVTVNTAKSYQRDSSGTKVDIFGRVLIKFKTDYAPLNG